MEINIIMYGITTAIVIIENGKLRIKNIIGSRLLWWYIKVILTFLVITVHPNLNAKVVINN